MDETEIFYDHYKDTFAYLREYLKQRDRLTIYCAFAIGIVFLSFFLPSDFENISKTLIQKQLTIELTDLNIIETLVFFVLLVLVMKYFQVNIYIQRQYDYLHKIEKKLTANFEEFKIEREGKAYLENYPWILTTADIIYKIGFPILLLIALAIKWIDSFGKIKAFKFFSLFTLNSIVIIAIIILTILYLSWIHFHDFKKNNEG